VSGRTAIVLAAVLLEVTLSFWQASPAATDFPPAQVMFGGMVYILETVLIGLLIMNLVEGRLWLIMGAAALGLIIGIIPNLAALPADAFFLLWLKAIVPAVCLGFLIRQGLHAGRSFVGASLVMAAVVVGMYLYSGGALERQFEQMMRSLNEMKGSLALLGFDAEAIDARIDSMSLIIKMLNRFVPALLILSGLGQLLVAFMVIERYYTRRDSYFPGFGAFIYWKIPEKLLYFMGAALAVRFAFGGATQTVVDNVILIMLIVYAFCGLGLIEYALRRLRLPTAVRVFLYVGLALMPLQALILPSLTGFIMPALAGLVTPPLVGLVMTLAAGLVPALAGMIDSHVDFRKVRAHSLG